MSSPVALLDGNVLIALTAREHSGHRRTMDWLSEADCDFATCPITEGALVRFHVRARQAAGAQLAMRLLVKLASQARHRFWPDDLPYAELPLNGLRGHKQVTDAYLAALARARGGRLATLDQVLAGWHSDVAVLI